MDPCQQTIAIHVGSRSSIFWKSRNYVLHLYKAIYALHLFFILKKFIKHTGIHGGKSVLSELQTLAHWPTYHSFTAIWWNVDGCTEHLVTLHLLVPIILYCCIPLVIWNEHVPPVLNRLKLLLFVTWLDFWRYDVTHSTSLLSLWCLCVSLLAVLGKDVISSAVLLWGLFYWLTFHLFFRQPLLVLRTACTWCTQPVTLQFSCYGAQRPDVWFFSGIF